MTITLREGGGIVNEKGNVTAEQHFTSKRYPVRVYFGSRYFNRGYIQIQ